MSVFVDTSALMAVVIEADDRHESAAGVWAELLADREPAYTTNYVLVETCTLLQRRHGVPYVRRFQAGALPTLRTVWVTPEQHEAALEALLVSNRRDLSLVDCTSFVVMRELGIEKAFALDQHFTEQGFRIVP
jgi:predicted nucleic acid-binding protein